MSILRTLRMVLWSFFGIRRRSAAEDEMLRTHPVLLVVVAVAAAALFVALLVGLAMLAVATLSRPA